MKKVLLLIACAGILAVIILAVLAKVYLTPDRVRAFLIPTVETALNRKVAADEIHISLFQGIRVMGFSIKEADGSTDFVSAKAFVLKYQFLPLLSKKIVVDELSLKSPDIRIVRDKDGRFNFETLGKKEKTKPSKEKEKTKENKSLPVSLLVNRLMLDDAVVSFEDQKKELPEVKGAIDLDADIRPTAEGGILSAGQISLRLEKLVLNPSKRIENMAVMLKYACGFNPAADLLTIEKADLRLQDISASLSGDVQHLLSSPQLNLALSLNKADTREVMKLVALFVDVKEISLSGGLSSEVKMTGTLAALKAEGRMSLLKVNGKYKNIPLAADGDINFKYQPGKARLDTSGFTLLDIPLSVKGDVFNLEQKTPKIDAALSIKKAPAEALLTTFQSFVDLPGLSLSGDMAGDLSVRGAPMEWRTLKTKGRIHLEKIGISQNDMKGVVDGTLKIGEEAITLDNLNMACGKNRIKITGTIGNYLTRPDICLNGYSQKMDIDDLLQNLGNPDKAAEEKKAAPSSTAVSEEPGPLNLPFSAKGQVRVDSVLYSGMTIDKFDLTYMLKDNRLSLKNTGKAGKGFVDLNAQVDFSKPGYTYSGSGKVAAISLEEVTNALLPKVKNTLFGLASADFKAAGAGIRALKQNLAVDSAFQVKNGKISTTALTRGLSGLLNLRELETLEFKTAKGTLQTQNGTAVLDGSFLSENFALYPKGGIGLVDQTLDLAADLKLSPRLTKKAMGSSVSKYLRDSEGWGLVPLRVTGSLSKPKFRVDVGKAGKKALEKEVDKLLEKLFD